MGGKGNKLEISNKRNREVGMWDTVRVSSGKSLAKMSLKRGGRVGKF